jgi:hypothetical protein
VGEVVAMAIQLEEADREAYRKGGGQIGMTEYRVLVSTDLGGDPDDVQALVHLLHFTDVLRLEGIVSSPGPGSTNWVAGIREWVERTDLDHLRSRGHPELMAESEVLAVCRQGVVGPGAPRSGASTEGSRLIVERALAVDPADRPLWVLVWGSLTDVAQALHDAPEIAPRIRINYIGSSNTTADPASRDYVYRFMRETYPRLWWIEDGVLPRFSRDTFRGVYLGGEQSGEWGSAAFVRAHIRGRGTTRGGRFPESLGDAFPLARHPAAAGGGEGVLKEGDAPTFLHLLSPVLGGVGDVEDPTRESWGGRFRRPLSTEHPSYFADLDAPFEVCQATINRWRVAYLAAWRERLAWYG